MKRASPAKKKSFTLHKIAFLLFLLVAGALFLTFNRVQNPEPTVSEPQAASQCFDNCYTSIKPGNGTYCKAYCGDSSTATSCFDNCYTTIKPGNGTYCRAYCGDQEPIDTACFNNCYKTIKPGNGTYCRNLCKGNTLTPTPTGSMAGTGKLTCVNVGTNGQLTKINDNAPAITYSGQGGYSTGGGSALYQRDYHYLGKVHPHNVATNYGSTALYTFTGNKVKIGFSGYTNRGFADIFIDNVKVDTYDLYRTGGVQTVIWDSLALSCASHTLKIVQSATPGRIRQSKLIVLDFIQYQACTLSSANVCAQARVTTATGCTDKTAGNACP